MVWFDDFLVNMLVCIFFSQKERMKYQKDYNKESIKKLEEKVTENKKKYEEFCLTSNAEVIIFVHLPCYLFCSYIIGGVNKEFWEAKLDYNMIIVSQLSVVKHFVLTSVIS